MDKIIGLLGTALILLAYLPQIYHLLHSRCSAGISRYAYFLWFLGASALLVHGVMSGDGVFILLQSINIFCTGVVIVLAEKYKGNRCSKHTLL